MPAPVVRSAAGAALAALAGLVVGLVGSLVHQAAVGAHRLPAGLVGALALTALWGLVLRRLAASSGVRLAGVVGWAAAVLVLSSRRPEGDLLVPGNVRGYGWMLAGFVVLTALAVLPARAARQGRG